MILKKTLRFSLYPILCFPCFQQTAICAPNGISDSCASLRNCFPNGIPIILMHQRCPMFRFETAISKPKKTIQITFTKSENMPSPYTISLLNDHIANETRLKHCKLTRIPTIIKHQRSFPKRNVCPYLNQYFPTR